jgi:hypothetical protein
LIAEVISAINVTCGKDKRRVKNGRSMCELVAERGSDIAYGAPNMVVVVVRNELTPNKGHIDKTVLIRGVQIINCHIYSKALCRNIYFFKLRYNVGQV